MSALGEEAVLAVYPSQVASATASPRFIVLAKLHPRGRLSAAGLLFGMGKSWRTTTYRHEKTPVTLIAATQPQLYFAFVGRLGILTNERQLIEQTLDGLSHANGFLTTLKTPADQRRRRRLNEQSPERVGSVYIRPVSSPMEELYGQLVHDGDEWMADLWITENPPKPSTEAILAARTMALQMPLESPLRFWHSAMSETWMMENLVLPFGLEWTRAVSSALETGRTFPLVFHVGAGTTEETFLPNLALLFPVKDVTMLRQDLRRGKVPVTLAKTPIIIRPGGKGLNVTDTAEIALGGGLRYFAGITSKEDTLILAATPLAAEALAGKPATTFAALMPTTPEVSDLFYLRARPADIAADAYKVAQLVSLAAKTSGDPINVKKAATFADILGLFPLFRQLDVDGMTTPDGFRALSHFTLNESAATPPAGANP
jgi:hypothetical protein